MALIKRFESISIDDDLESCKDYIETLDEFEDDIEAYSFKEGYFNYGEISNKMSSESSKKALSFSLRFKDDSKNKQLILNKSDFDRSISLIQRAKYLYSKFEIYCSNIIVEISAKSVKFLLLFDSKDESEKRMAKFERIYKSFLEYFSDYVSSKTFYINSGNKSDYQPIIDEIKKDDQILPIFNKGVDREIEFRFTTDINRNDNVINIKPKTFRYRIPSISSKWTSLRSNKKLIDFVSSEVSKKMLNGWKIKQKDIIDNIDVTIDNGTISIKVK